MTPPAAAAAIPAPRPATRPGTRPAPARRSRPVAPSPAPARPRRRPGAAAPARRLAPGAAAVETSARLLDRLIRSRTWIVLIAFALIGIVAMQLWLLKLNGGIGRAIEHEGYLQRTNATLAAENSSYSAGDLIEQQAAAAGMSIVPAGKLVFLHAHPGVDERLAASRLAQPVQAPTESSTTTAGTQPSAPATQSVAGAETPAAGSSAATSPSPQTTPAESSG
jgi:hypothetical protein